jgi:hypothetical protein
MIRGHSTGADLTAAQGLNDAEIVVGDCYDVALRISRSYAFNPDTGAFEIFDVPFPSWSGSGARGINNAGAIVGGFSESGYFRGTTGVFQEIRVSGSTFTLPRSINTWGHSTGLACTTEWCQCFVRNYYSGALELFNVPGAGHTDCHVITDKGELAGIYLDAEWNFHGFVATRKQ